MPDASQTGANVIAYRANGNSFIYQGEFSILNSHGVVVRFYANDLTIYGSREGGEIELKLASPHTPVAGESYKFFANNNIGIHKSYKEMPPAYESASNGSISFARFDSVIAGTFAFTGYALDSNGNKTADSIAITDG